MEQLSTGQTSMLQTLGTGFMVFFLALMVFAIIVHWKIYAKANQPGWACIVPVYNLIVYLKIIGRPASWIFVYIGCIAGYIIGVALMASGSSLALSGILTMVSSLALLVIAIIDTHRLSKSFGKEAGFTVGLVLLWIIFLAILAFSDASYVGPNGVGEAVSNDPEILHN